MNINILDTESAYRRMMTAPDDEARAAIFQREIVDPFSNLAAMYGGDAAFKQWGMTPDLYVGDQRDHWFHTLDVLATHDAWNRATVSLECAKSALRHGGRGPKEVPCRRRPPIAPVTIGRPWLSSRTPWSNWQR